MIRDKLVQQIREHVAAEYPREACGLIVQAGRSQRYKRCRNVHPDPLNHFQISAEDFAAAEDGGDVLAVVHSHPDGTSAPSVHDRASCDAQGLPWYILSWPEGDLARVEPGAWPRPLVGRQYVYGLQDCYSIAQDWYREHRGLELWRPQSSDGWWDRQEADFFFEHFRRLGFVQVEDPQVGDMIIMQIHGSPVAQHCGIYVGDGRMLHHLPGQLSGHVLYGGYWRERTRLIIRHTGE